MNSCFRVKKKTKKKTSLFKHFFSSINKETYIYVVDRVVVRVFLRGWGRLNLIIWRSSLLPLDTAQFLLVGRRMLGAVTGRAHWRRSSAWITSATVAGPSSWSYRGWTVLHTFHLWRRLLISRVAVRKYWSVSLILLRRRSLMHWLRG